MYYTITLLQHTLLSWALSVDLWFIISQIQFFPFLIIGILFFTLILLCVCAAQHFLYFSYGVTLQAVFARVNKMPIDIVLTVIAMQHITWRTQVIRKLLGFAFTDSCFDGIITNRMWCQLIPCANRWWVFTGDYLDDGSGRWEASIFNVSLIIQLHVQRPRTYIPHHTKGPIKSFVPPNSALFFFLFSPQILFSLLNNWNSVFVFLSLILPLECVQHSLFLIFPHWCLDPIDIMLTEFVTRHITWHTEVVHKPAMLGYAFTS